MDLTYQQKVLVSGYKQWGFLSSCVSAVVHAAECDASCSLQYGTVRDARCIVGIQTQRRENSGEHKGLNQHLGNFHHRRLVM